MYTKGDFHIHSINSDGELPPEEIVILAKSKNVDIIAMTDHNKVSGNEEAIVCGEYYGIKVIPGIELSTRYKGNKVHVLGYFTDNIYKDKEFKNILANIYKGNFMECRRYFRNKINFKSDKKKISTESGIEFLKYFNAKVVLAHPTLLNKDIFNKIIDFNFDGIEAKYYRNKPGDTEYFINIAKSKKLIYTAGSDFHCIHNIDLKHGILGDTYLDQNEIENFLNILK